MKERPFFKQADLLIQILPFVNAETCFALKGGTAINFFVRNFPRLSVDIDLVYMPVEDRTTSLRAIDGALKRIAARIRRSMPAAEVTERKLGADVFVVKLMVRVSNVGEVKIEPNTVLRGAVHPTAALTLVSRAVEVFGRSATMQTLSLPELYGGKLCAALDRQHPRDLFDVHGLLQAEGITDEVRRAFVIFLASHDRPINELLTPRRQNLERVFGARPASLISTMRLTARTPSALMQRTSASWFCFTRSRSPM